MVFKLNYSSAQHSHQAFLYSGILKMLHAFQTKGKESAAQPKGKGKGKASASKSAPSPAKTTPKATGKAAVSKTSATAKSGQQATDMPVKRGRGRPPKAKTVVATPVQQPPTTTETKQAEDLEEIIEIKDEVGSDEDDESPVVKDESPQTELSGKKIAQMIKAARMSREKQVEFIGGMQFASPDTDSDEEAYTILTLADIEAPSTSAARTETKRSQKETHTAQTPDSHRRRTESEQSHKDSESLSPESTMRRKKPSILDGMKHSAMLQQTAPMQVNNPFIFHKRWHILFTIITIH